MGGRPSEGSPPASPHLRCHKVHSAGPDPQTEGGAQLHALSPAKRLKSQSGFHRLPQCISQNRTAQTVHRGPGCCTAAAAKCLSSVFEWKRNFIQRGYRWNLMRVCSRKAFYEWSLNAAVLSAEKVRNETVDSPLMPRQAADSLVLLFLCSTFIS